MKGLSVAVIGSVVLALIGVTVMVGLFTDLSPVDAESGFCGVYNGISPSLPDALTPSVTGCSSTSIDYKEISSTNANRFTLKLATGLMECWDEYRGYDTDFKRCNAWSVPELDRETNESYLNQKMMQNSICPDLIENSDLETGSGETCGASNNIRFRPESITGNRFIIVGFNSSNGEQFVEVK